MAQPQNVDCFYFLQGQCKQKKCRFQHRDLALNTSEICENWRRTKNCRNKQCTNIHYDQEALRRFFLCRLEKNGECKITNCLQYHEKHRTIYDDGGSSITLPPNPVPRKAKSQRGKTEFSKTNHIMTQNLVRSASQFITETLIFVRSVVNDGKLSSERAKMYIKEMMHAVLFLLHINMPSIQPNDVMPGKMLETLTKLYYDVFYMYKTHLPLRSPYSVLLDLVVESFNQDEEMDILNCLWGLNEKMLIPRVKNEEQMCGNDFAFASRVISYCYFQDVVTNNRTKKYFGASIACKGKVQREILIDVSCMKTWNQKVAIGVTTATIKGNKPLRLPPTVHSTAYRMINNPLWRNGKEVVRSLETSSSEQADLELRPMKGYLPMPPCDRCLEIFPNITFNPERMEDNHPPKWEHGNCAECESVSKLLNADRILDMRVAMPDVVYFHTSLTGYPEVWFGRLFEELMYERSMRLITNLKKTKFELGVPLLCFDPSFCNNSAALVPVQPVS
ncbi:uncharacterized protein LOC114664831 [Erpetoichthys calabaricus]|uniref:uncharacterized protein LOC114664831 n=1 Tax=Erpetoichthys calabaricus TaxID=27687 RepID=UPI00223429B1|nr:uncharacterized protein LOC114664831 [Erpetoichthys calabaricus]